MRRTRGAQLGLVVSLVVVAFTGQTSAWAGTWSRPVDGPVVAEYRNDNSKPYSGGFHRGIDIAAPVGTPVYAAVGGRVLFAGSLGDSGLVVSVVAQGSEFVTTYSHLDSASVSRGQSIVQGRRIGSVGTTGASEGPGSRLHFGVRSAGDDRFYFDPMELLSDRSDVPGDPSVPPVVAVVPPAEEPTRSLPSAEPIPAGEVSSSAVPNAAPLPSPGLAPVQQPALRPGGSAVDSAGSPHGVLGPAGKPATAAASGFASAARAVASPQREPEMHPVRTASPHSASPHSEIGTMVAPSGSSVPHEAANSGPRPAAASADRRSRSVLSEGILRLLLGVALLAVALATIGNRRRGGLFRAAGVFFSRLGEGSRGLVASVSRSAPGMLGRLRRDRPDDHLGRSRHRLPDMLRVRCRST